MIKQHSFFSILTIIHNLILLLLQSHSVGSHTRLSRSPLFFIKSVVSISPFSVSLFSFSLFLSLLSSSFVFFFYSVFLFLLFSFFLFLCCLLSFLCHCLQQPIVLLPPSSLMNPPRSVPLFCSPFFFPLPHSLSPLSSFSLPSSRFFPIPTFARDYPPRNLPFLTHVTTSPSSFFSSPSRYFFSLSYSSFSLPFFVCISCLFTHHQHLFFQGNQRSFFPSTFNNHSKRHLFSFRDLILHLAFTSLNSFFSVHLLLTPLIIIVHLDVLPLNLFCAPFLSRWEEWGLFCFVSLASHRITMLCLSFPVPVSHLSSPPFPPLFPSHHFCSRPHFLSLSSVSHSRFIAHSTHPPCLRINTYKHTHAHPRHLQPPQIKQHTCTNTRTRTLKNGVKK
ncbi:hypothetical protein F5H01DRAFT_59178 [Linnemannia elongata]|nr:hypothetical protein F5H01DRAFT_59178 [Linnemannia elongata]